MKLEAEKIALQKRFGCSSRRRCFDEAEGTQM